MGPNFRTNIYLKKKLTQRRFHSGSVTIYSSFARYSEMPLNFSLNSTSHRGIPANTVFDLRITKLTALPKHHI